MAEISLLAALIPKLVALLDLEVQFHGNIRKDLEDIKGELEHIKAFLMDADNIEEEVLKNDVWVRQVREAAFEAEDIVDEFHLHFARDDLDAGLSASCGCCCLISMMRNVGAQRDMGFKMQDIKSKFVYISEMKKRYATKKAADIRRYDPPRDVYNVGNDELVGTEEHEKKLIDMLFGTNGINYSARTNVVSVFGMGGVGKTSLVKKVYDSAEVRNHFKGRVWITISRTFEPDDKLRDLIRSLSGEATHPEPDERNRYLIIFDDVRSTSAWNSIRRVLSETLCVSQVVITTREMATALAACGGCSEWTYELTPLSDDKSLELFYTKIFGSQTANWPRHLNEDTESILKECGGLPLAIGAIAGVLVSRDMAEWGRANFRLQEEVKGAKRILLSIFCDLPFELKPCFLYFSVFPEDYLIQKTRLTRLWVAEGFVDRSGFMTLEEAAESYLDELISRSLIQVVERTGDGRVFTCRIHDLLREMIIEKAKNQRFSAFPREYDDLQSLNPRRLSLSSDLAMVQKCSLGFGQLRSLFKFDDKHPVKLSMPALFSDEFDFKLLSVLDLQGTILDKFPSGIVKMENLKYLNLSHTDVGDVPSSISRLWRLESLNLRSTLVSELPKEILKLQRLRILSAYHRRDKVNYGVKTPAGIQGLKSLDNLYFIDAGQFSIIAAKDLARLRRLGVTNLSYNNTDAICSTINDLRDLRILLISSSDNDGWTMNLRSLVSPSQSLRCLYLTGKLECLPQWLGTLKNLVTIHLKSSKLQVDPAEILGQLPSLLHVELSDAYTGSEMRFRADHFLTLKVLGLSDFTELDTVTFESQTMPNLERLKLDNNKLVKTVPSGIENLSKLKELNFFEMPSELETAIRGSSGHESSDYEKIKHVREANWVFKVDNVWQIESLFAITAAIEGQRKSQILAGRSLIIPKEPSSLNLKH